MAVSTKQVREFIKLLLVKDADVFKLLLKEYWRLDKQVEASLVQLGLDKPALLNIKLNYKYPLAVVEYYCLHWVIKCNRVPDYRQAYYLSRVYLRLIKDRPSA